MGGRVERYFRLTRAIGPDGVELAREVPFEPRRPVEVTLRLPPPLAGPAGPSLEDEGPLMMLGVVVAGGGEATRRVAFTALDEDAKRRILRYVEERILTP